MFAPGLGHIHQAAEAEGRVGEGQATRAKEGEERGREGTSQALESRSSQHEGLGRVREGGKCDVSRAGWQGRGHAAGRN